MARETCPPSSEPIMEKVRPTASPTTALAICSHGEKTAPVKALKRLEKMQEKVNEAILNYQNDSSNYYVRDTVEFTRDDGWNSYLAFGAVSYIITVRTETRSVVLKARANKICC